MFLYFVYEFVDKDRLAALVGAPAAPPIYIFYIVSNLYQCHAYSRPAALEKAPAAL